MYIYRTQRFPFELMATGTPRFLKVNGKQMFSYLAEQLCVKVLPTLARQSARASTWKGLPWPFSC